MKMMKSFVLGIVLMPVMGWAECPQWMQGEIRMLRSEQTLDLCDEYRGRPMLIVNTASYCGYTPQFKGLEALYQRYRDRGLVVLGFPSDDFKQEADREAETAKVCYVNYGVSFPMMAPVRVTGAEAHPVFAALAQASGAPQWNFYKYLVDRNGRVVASFPSKVTPDSAGLVGAVERALGQ